MKKFLDLLRVAKEQGYISKTSETDDGLDRKKYDLSHLDRWIESGLQVLVFEPRDGMPSDRDPEPKTDADGIPILDNAPFPIFSVEFLGENNHVTINRYEDQEHWIPCIIAIESSPCKFIFVAHVKAHGIERVAIFDQGFEGVFQEILGRLKSESTGEVSMRQRVKKASEKGKHTIRKLIYVSPDKKQYVNEFGSREIDYSHRWLVRGHWRKHNGLGKDRLGRYCINGFTWVSEHAKGPEGKPLITDKVRLIS